MIQTWAILVDSYRLLLAKKLFWATLAISALVVLAFASIGFTEDGISIFFGVTTLEAPEFAKGTALSRALYVGIFTSFIVPIWLAWVATILALVSTTTIYPDFMSEGAIDVVLAKPLHRAKVFFVKYLGSLLFVFAQVGIFCVGVFFAIGFRLGEWNWMLFAAVPLITLFYSFLYCVNVLAGVLWRSGIAALLVTMLFWFALFIVQTSENAMVQITTQHRMEAESHDAWAASLENRLERMRNPATFGERIARTALTPEAQAERIERLEADIATARERAEDRRASAAGFEKWRGRIGAMMNVLPRTQGTIGLLERWLIPKGQAGMLEVMMGGAPPPPPPEPAQNDDPGLDVAPLELEAAPPRPSVDSYEVSTRIQDELREIPAWRVLGPSLLFELFVLGLACWIFVRRDF
ncbi:MAG: hypothetical protein EA379_06865 [Phycisphaerales bacterium]|nr:MAG: hypothetical protein EA379_06865 [Phycisphaerales bacterium]